MKRDKIRPTIETVVEMTYPTCDDWSPNHARNTVAIRVHLFRNPDKVGRLPDGLIRTTVSGADDTGMERDIRCPISEYEAKVAEIHAWIRTIPNPVSKAWLLGQGFRWW